MCDTPHTSGSRESAPRTSASISSRGRITLSAPPAAAATGIKPPPNPPIRRAASAEAAAVRVAAE
eukprot:3717034-Prymnesium_polylepis.1